MEKNQFQILGAICNKIKISVFTNITKGMLTIEKTRYNNL